MVKKIFSGVQPTGNLHLGNYLGALKNFASLQKDMECIYCVVAHGAILRIREKNPLIADQIATNYRKADISDRQKALLDFAIKVSQKSAEVTENDINILQKQGFSKDDVWDIGAITALFALSNRIANMAAIRPNDEFYLMGRTERK